MKATIATPSTVSPADVSVAHCRLMREWSDLKRIHSSRFVGSFAQWRYRQIMRRLQLTSAVKADADHLDQRLELIAWEEAVRSILATRCGAMDPESLIALGVPASELSSIFAPALAEHGDAWSASGIEALHDALARLCGNLSNIRSRGGDDEIDANGVIDHLVDRLVNEPRSGATAVGKSRVLVVPQESHADHCYMTAVTSVLTSDSLGAKPGKPFLVGLMHHLHNAFLPDAGFGGEMLLGERLHDVMSSARDQAMNSFDDVWKDHIGAALDATRDLVDVQSEAFHAADAIDRVLQNQFHQTMAEFDAGRVMRELDLIHEGPLQTFQKSMLVRFGIEGS